MASLQKALFNIFAKKIIFDVDPLKKNGLHYLLKFLRAANITNSIFKLPAMYRHDLK